jgi:hypothetical protein
MHDDPLVADQLQVLDQQLLKVYGAGRRKKVAEEIGVDRNRLNNILSPRALDHLRKLERHLRDLEGEP